MALRLIKRPATLVTLPFTLAKAADQQDLPKQLTLSQAITIALSKNSILRTAQSCLDQASGRYEQSRSPLSLELGPDARQTILLKISRNVAWFVK